MTIIRLYITSVHFLSTILSHIEFKTTHIEYKRNTLTAPKSRRRTFRVLSFQESSMAERIVDPSVATISP